MALALYFAPTTPMTAQKYDECIAALKKAGQAHPPGRLYHSAFGTGDSLQIFDVWTSQEAFEQFGQVLMPIHGADRSGIGATLGDERAQRDRAAGAEGQGRCQEKSPGEEESRAQEKGCAQEEKEELQEIAVSSASA